MADVKATNGHELHRCKKCLGQFKSLTVYELHQRYCRGVESCGKVFLMPDSGKWSQLSYRKLSNGTGAPFVIYAGLDVLVEPKEAGPSRAHKSQLSEKHRSCIVGYKTNSYFTDIDDL